MSFAKDFRYASVVVSAVAGATDVGLASKIGKLGIVAKFGIELVHDATAAAAKSTLVNTISDKVVGDIASKQTSKSAEGKGFSKTSQ